MDRSNRITGWKWRALLGMAALAALLAGCGESPTATPSPAPTSGPATASPAATTAAPALTVASTAAPRIALTATPASTLSSPAATATGNAARPPAVPTESNAAYTAAIEDLAKRSNISASAIKVVSVASEEFSDASLGCPDPRLRYAQVITPGYRLQLEVNGQTYDYRTNLNGSRVLLCGPGNNPVIKTP